MDDAGFLVTFFAVVVATFFGTAFFTIAQVILFAFSATICNAIKHYIDGLFFFTLCMLLSVMMVYKYWDSITVRYNILLGSFRRIG